MVQDVQFFLALSAFIVQMDFVNSMNCSFVIVFSFKCFSLLYSPFENIKIYS